jgi:RimJ/RimL family protein N-acetyltransferase
VNDLLEGEKVSLKLVEKEGLGKLHDWLTDPTFTGTLEPFPQVTLKEIEKTFRGLHDELWWWIRAKNDLWIGFLSNRLRDGQQEIKFLIDPESRRQGYATEAVKIITNYLFTSQDIVRIQAETHPQNTPAINVLEKNGFTREGVLRKNVFTRGAWRDSLLFSVIRDEWTPT